MKKTKLQWLETEYCGSADETIQPVLVNGVLFYTMFDRHGFNYVFPSIYAIHLHLSGVSNQYIFTCGSEKDLIEYLEKMDKI